MFANRYTAFVDACSLASVRRRNFLLSLADAEFFRVRWSGEVLNETETAIEKLLAKRGYSDSGPKAALARAKMEKAFPEASVDDFQSFLDNELCLPDPDDLHVLAAALKAQAQAIVTENLKDFPAEVLDPLNLEARSADDFIADTIALDTGRAIQAIRNMRMRLKRPEKTPEQFLRDCEADGLLATTDQLRPFSDSI